MKKRMMCAFLALVLCLTQGMAGAAVAEDKTVRRDGLTLCYDSSDGSFLLTDGDRHQWYSSPQDIEEQAGLKGAAKYRLKSVVTGTVVNLGTGKETAFSSALMAENGKASCTPITDGYALTLTPEEGVSFVVEVVLRDGFLSVRLPLEQLRESETLVLRDLQLLPSLGAGGAEDKGFLLIPDGSGALIEFNNGRKGQYDEPVYGTDKAFIRTALALSKMDISLPVYGIERNGSGMLAVLHEGAAASSIRASSAGNGSTYNTVYPSYTLRRKDVQSITEGVTQTLYESPRTTTGTLELRLYPVNEPDSGYVGMARTLREYMTTELGMSPVGVGADTTVVSIYGGVKQRAKFLGIPLWNVAARLTSFDQMQEIAADFLGAGTSGLILELREWEQHQILDEGAGKATVPGALGGTKGLKELSQFTADHDISIFAGSNSATFYKNGNGYSIKGDSVRTIAQEPAAQFDYYRASYSANLESARYLASPATITAMGEKWLSSLTPYGFTGVSYIDIGGMLYSDFSRRSPTAQEDTQTAFRSVLARAGEQGDVLTTGGQLYAAARSHIIMDPPCESSKMAFADAEIPFYQIAMSGLANYTTPAINARANQNQWLLYALETGSLIHWQVVGGNTDLLPGTRLAELGGADYALNRDFILSATEEYAPLLEGLVGQSIVNHERLTQNVRRTTYANGVKVTVNYSSRPYGGVPAGGYRVEGGEGN